jgi:hypothetical protein
MSELNFEGIEGAIGVAGYIEQILASEQQWIMNRLSWLLVSQSFLVVAFVTLGTTSERMVLTPGTLYFLKWGIPWVGICCCILVGFAIFAAVRESVFLGIERVRLTAFINERCKCAIPHLCNISKTRDRRWTYIVGSLPHWLLPWILAAFWILALRHLQ